MKITWIPVVLFSSALLVGCNDRGTENAQNTEQNEGTSVAVAPEATSQANLQPDAAPQATSPNRGSSGARETTGNRPAPRIEAAPRPLERAEREAPRAVPAPRITTRVLTIPAGTSLPLELTTAVSSETAHIEQPVSARLRQSVMVDGVTVLPAGAVVNGEVIDVDRPGRVQGRARLGLRFTSVTFGGRREELRTDPVTFQGEQTKGEDATKIGAGAGVGAILGGILGGGDGAAKGAAIGGAAGTGAVLATRGKDVTLASGTDVSATLTSAVDIEVR